MYSMFTCIVCSQYIICWFQPPYLLIVKLR